jgi:hypothetical protein
MFICYTRKVLPYPARSCWMTRRSCNCLRHYGLWPLCSVHTVPSGGRQPQRHPQHSPGHLCTSASSPKLLRRRMKSSRQVLRGMHKPDRPQATQLESWSVRYSRIGSNMVQTPKVSHTEGNRASQGFLQGIVGYYRVYRA